MNKTITGRIKAFLLTAAIAPALIACSPQAGSDSTDAAAFDELEYKGSMELSYATGFLVDYYGDYSLIKIEGGDSFFLVPEGRAVPSGLPSGTTVLSMPLDKTYLVSTSVYDVIRKIGAEDNLCLSGTKENGWYLKEAREAMEQGRLLYAGKYSAPDYELILSKGCNLAIENTMILHTPQVREKLIELGIPVLIEKSSYEADPRGRLEWIKLYGLLYGKEDEAESFFEGQVQRIADITGNNADDTESSDIREDERDLENGTGSKEAENTLDKAEKSGQTGNQIAVFSINSLRNVTVRKPGDYISKMIEMAGGSYALKNIENEDDNALSTMNMQLEDFYIWAKDADIFIYNSTIEGEISSIAELISENEILSGCKAVKEGRVYCTTNDFFQTPTGMADFIGDIHSILNNDNRDLKYLNPLEKN